MKKLLTFLLTALLAFGVGWAGEVTITMSEQEWTNAQVVTQVSSGPVTINFTKGGSNDPKYYTSDQTLRVYNGGTVTVKATTKIQKIEFDGTLYLSYSGNDGNYSKPTWTANSSSTTTEVSFSNTGTTKIKSVTVTYEEGSTSSSVDYSLATSVNTVDDYVLVYTDNYGSYALSTLFGGQAATNGFTLSNNVVSVTSDAEILVFSLESAGDNLYYIKGSDGNYWGCGNSSLSTSSTKPDDGSYKWQITVDNSGDAIVYNPTKNLYLKYRYYSTNHYYRPYATSQSDAYNGKLYSHAGVAPAACLEPEINPDGGTFTGSAVVTITSPTEGATIYYTTDGNDPVVNSRATNTIANGGSVTLTENCTLKALAAKDGMAPSAIVTSQSFTINQAGGSGDFVLVTDASTLNAGDEIIFVSSGTSGSADAMSTTQNSNNRSTTSVTVVAGTPPTVTPTASTQILKLEGTIGGWYFKDEDRNGYLYAASSSNNHLKTGALADVGDNAKATISLTANVATIQFQGNYTRNYLRFNGNIVSCYGSSSTISDNVYIYRRTTTPTVEAPVFSPEPGEYPSVQEVTISCPTDGAMIHYTYNGGPEQTGTSPITLNVNSFATIVAWATLDGYEDSEQVTATYNINLTPSLTADPNPLNINDDNTSGGRTGDFTVTGANLPSNVGVDVMSGNFSRTTTGGQTPDWGFVNNNGVNGTVTVTYNGNALSESGVIRLASGNVTTNVDVNYLYTGPIYLFGNIGVDADHINNFDFSNGVAMTRNTTDGTYSVNITAVGQNGGSDSWMFFSKSQGDESTAVSTKFGPDSNGPWYLQGQTDYTGQSVQIDAADTGSNAATIHLNPGEYTVQVNPNDNTFTISALVHAPVISLASGTYTGTQEVTITCATPGAAIYYTTDGSEPSANNGTLYDGNAISISESVTLKAVAVSNGVTSSVASAEYLITPPFVAKDYEMLTNINDLVAGQTYLIVYKTDDDATAAKVMGPVENNIGTVEDATENNGIISSTEDMAPVTLVGNTDNWKLLTTQGVLTAQDANNLYYDNPNHTWTINKVDNANTFAIESNTVTGRYLQYNPSNTRFACYKTNSNQKYVYIYKESSTPAILANPTTVSIELAAGEVQGSNTFTVGGRNLSEGVTLTLSAEDQAKGFSLSTNSISQEAALAGNVEVTVTYNGSGANETASITLSSAGATDVTVTVNATREPLTVTISPASCNFVGQTMGEQVTINANVAGATIEYSTDGGNTWLPYTGGFSVSVATVGGAVTVMARATLTAGGNTYTSETVSETYTRQPKGETLYEKVTDESQIKAGEKYVIVYEGTTPVAFNGTYSSNNNYFGSGVNVAWRTQNQVVDIANTDAIVFTLGGSKDNWTLKATQGYLESTNDDTGVGFYNNASSGYEWQTPSSGSGYGLTTCERELRYNTQLADRGPFRLYTNNTGVPAYLYVLHPAVLAPEITPATGEYTGHQDVTITAEDGTTVYYTTDGSDPATSSTRVEYTGQFAVHYDANGPTTIKAVAVDDEGNVSAPAEVVYTWIAPKVTIRPASREVYNPTLTVVIGCNPVDATVYYTTDGSEPSSSNGTLYEGPFELTFASLGDQATVKAIAYNDDNVPSTVDVATYTYAEKVINVDAPFFSPLEGKDGGYSGTYYGDQTLEIATNTANADIYYVIEPVSGTTPPSSVSDPTKSSTHYSEPYRMTVGNSYRVKAIAYIGDHASTISEGYYTILPFQGGNHVYQNLKDFNDNCPTGVSATFVNPVQVVYHSTYTNNGEFAEYCYLRDNTDYACVYFGKRDTHGYHIFSMGDWLDGSEIAGVTNIWKENGVEMNFHIQLGTSSHEITSWPTTILGNSEILPEEITNAVIVAGTAEGSNSWGHYVHLRNTTLRNVQDYSASDPKHTGLINDGTADAYYYDKFYRWSEGTCIFNGNNDQINCIDNYDQAFFDEKQAKGATFDIYGIVDYYAKYNPPFEVCPIDFLWVYKPVITPASNDQCTTQQVVDITVETPEWNGAVTPTIYYKTDDMDDWAEFIGPFVVNSDTHVEAYAELPSTYGDMMHSVTVEADYKFIGIKDPVITPESQVIEIVTGDESVDVTISTNEESDPATVTLYTLNGEVPTLENGTVVTDGEITLTGDNAITETTTVTAISYLEVKDDQGNVITTLWSNPVTCTYTFVKKNSVVFDLVKTAPQEGNVYVIVNKQANMGLSTTQNENNRGSVGVMFVDDTKEKVYGNDELAQFVLEKANAGRYYFKNINGDNTGYLVVTTNDNANLKTAAATSTYSEASVSVAQDNGNPATIMFNYDGTNRTLRYYAKGRVFSTYSDASLNEDVYLYGLEATPLAYIESNETPVEPVEGNKQVLVSDELIGVWAVVNPQKGINQLWAKDQGNVSIDKTSIVDGQTDYVKDILGLQTRDWDQSNWVVLDFSGLNDVSAFDYESRKLMSATVKGYYTDDLNYTIKLTEAPTKVDENPVEGYPGYDGNYAENNGEDKYYYNHYTPANFMKDNLNAPYGDGAEAGSASPVAGKKIFFMNPKVQEIAQVWGVWMGNDRFDVLECNVQPNGTSINGYDLSGSFTVHTWDYNLLGMGEENTPSYGSPVTAENPDALQVGEPYLFHVIITRNDRNVGGPRRGPGAAPDGSFGISPADLPSGRPDPTAVKNVIDAKQVVSVSYYNIMGMESETPFEGVNIVVTRYSDGSSSTYKVLR